MQEFVTILNKDLSCGTLSEIIQLKQQYWNYPYDSQIAWIRKNLREDDIHILCYDSGKLIAYLNLVHLSVIADGAKMKMLGVGNVCVSQEKRRQKIGNELMKQANKVIRDFKKEGLLLCHAELIPFYKSADWNELVNARVTINGEPYRQRIMCLSSTVIACESLKIDRNF